MKTFLFILLFSTSAMAAPENIKVTVKGMVCSFCAQGVTKKLNAEPAVSKVDVSLEKKIVSIELKENSKLSDEKITTLLTDSGYNVERIDRN